MGLSHIQFLNEGGVRGDRVFVNITTAGCGSGCSYCYIVRPNGPQTFIDTLTLQSTADSLLRCDDFIEGQMGTIISLCPDSDPFKSEESTERFESVLQQLIPLGNPIQIPTKEVYPKSTLALINRLQRGNQVVAFTSFSSLSKASKIEPRAASVDERFSNFQRCRDYGVFGCLYLKPFLPGTIADLGEFVSRANAARPDALCVGILYSTSDKGDDAQYNHPVHVGLSANSSSHFG